MENKLRKILEQAGIKTKNIIFKNSFFAEIEPENIEKAKEKLEYAGIEYEEKEGKIIFDIEKNIQKYIVVRNQNTDALALTKREDFEECNLCECYDQYGIQWGCFEAGCWTEETAEELEKTTGEKWDGQEDHTKVRANTYWDGSNWKSDILDDDDRGFDWEELSEPDQFLILLDWILNCGAPFSIWIEKGGAKTICGAVYGFEYSRYQRDAGYICFPRQQKL